MFDTATENVRWIAHWGRQDHAVVQESDAVAKIGSVGIIGAGMMGTAIAAAHVQFRMPVVIHDIDAASLEHVPARVADALDKADSHFMPGAFRRYVRATGELADVARCDLVLESIVESLPAKTALYARLQEYLGQRTIIASNTSTIPLGRLASGLPDASRFCGLHFCHPVQQRPLVEIIRGLRTSDRTMAAAVAHARRIDRMPLVVEDGPGFVVNRLLFPYLGEALELLRSGVPAASIEGAAAEFGMTVGPLRMIDEIGLDTTLQAAWVLTAALPGRIIPSPLLVALVKAGRLGRKTGAGFFVHNGSADDITTDLDPAAAKIIAHWIEASPPCTSEDLSCRLVLPMLLEATRILEEGQVRDVRDIDMAVLFGLGFPATKGGLLWWADTLGAERIVALLQSLGTVMGARAEPTPMLKTMARTGQKFYRN